jgi:hypothetical protein
MRIATLVFLIAGVTACASQPPDWIMRPAVEGGWAATECVRDSGNLSLDRQIAVAKARAEIAKQVELRVAAMDKTYTRLSEEANQGGSSGAATASQSKAFQSAFESVSKQIAEQTLGGLAPTRVEYVELNDARNLCAMIAVDRSAVRSVYDQVVSASGQTLAPAASEALYRDFSAPSN